MESMGQVGFDVSNRAARQQLFWLWISRVTYHDHEAEIEPYPRTLLNESAGCREALDIQ
jgi:hypothetical protein